MRIPDYVPPCIREGAFTILPLNSFPTEKRVLAERLLTDPRMVDAWEILGDPKYTDGHRIAFFFESIWWAGVPVVGKTDVQRAGDKCDQIAKLAEDLCQALSEFAGSLGTERLGPEQTLIRIDGVDVYLSVYTVALTKLQAYFSELAGAHRESARGRRPVTKPGAKNAARTAYMLRLSSYVQSLFGSPLDRLVGDVTSVVLVSTPRSMM